MGTVIPRFFASWERWQGPTLPRLVNYAGVGIAILALRGSPSPVENYIYSILILIIYSLAIAYNLNLDENWDSRNP